jgi:toxin ParE1/3/4
MLEVVFSEQAELDLKEVREWYESIRIGLELEFLICIEAEIEVIRKAPFVNKEYFLNVRKAIINKFPYGIYYLVENERITVLSVAHHKRGSKTIKKKLKK